MDEGEARELLARTLEPLRQLPHEMLRERIQRGGKEELGVEAPSGTFYLVRIEISWDDNRRRRIMVLGSIHDGGWRAYAPLTESFVIAADGSVVPRSHARLLVAVVTVIASLVALWVAFLVISTTTPDLDHLRQHCPDLSGDPGTAKNLGIAGCIATVGTVVTGLGHAIAYVRLYAFVVFLVTELSLFLAWFLLGGPSHASCIIGI